jgi:serine phosphatase RsbU (regulator of sigma subunit)/lipopolysaccharide biosynthesis regulator YciM
LILKRAIFLLVFFLPVFLSAQTKVDSLRARINDKALPDDTNRVQAIYALANIVVNTDQQEAIKLADQGLALADKLAYKRAQSFLMVTKGDAYRKMNKPDDAVKAFEEGIKRAIPINYHKGAGIMANRAGATLADQGKSTEAIAMYKRAVVYDSLARSYALWSEAYRSIGEIYTSLGEHTLAMTNFLHAIRVAKAGDEKVQVGNAYLSMGNGQQYQKDYDNALVSFKKSSAVMEEAKYPYGVAGGYISIGNIYYYKHDYENAITNYKISKDVFTQMKNDPIVARINVDIGNVLFEQGKFQEALSYYEPAMEVFIKYGDDEGMSGCYGNIGAAYRELGKHKESESYYLKSLEIARKNNYTNWKRDSYSGMADLYFDMAQYKNAYLYKDSAATMDSLIIGQEHTRLSKEMEARYDNQQKEAEISHLNAVTAEQALVDKKQKQIIIAVSIGLGIVLLLSFFLVSVNTAKRKANYRLEEQNKIIAEKNKDITDSITYALRIQQSVMPDERILQKAVSDYFILNKPRDIVSGDFFWLAQKEDRTYIAVADCTGHGVPGALVSVVGINLLNKIIEMPGTPSPAGILEQLHPMMINALNKDAEARESNDGMDIALLCIDKNAGTAIFAGASRPLYYANANGFYFFKGDRYSIAGEKKESDAPFTEQEISLSGAVTLYLSSDGFVDQFGEKTGKKFLSKRFQELLQSITALPMKEQQARIEKEFESWKGNIEQVDDILVMGIKV